MSRLLIVCLLLCATWSFAETPECEPSRRIDCEKEIAAAGPRLAEKVANDCAAAKALIQFCNRGNRVTLLEDLNEAAVAALVNGRDDALGEAVQKLQRADRLATSRDDLSCQAAIVSNLGMAHYFQKQYDQAIKDFTRAADYADAAPPVPVVERPQLVTFTIPLGTSTCFGAQRLTVNEILVNRGLAHVRAEHFREAEEDFDTVARDGISTREIALIDMLATNALDRHADAEAIRLATKMLDGGTDPIGVRRANTVKGIAQWRQRMLTESVASFQAALAAGAPDDESQGTVQRFLAEILMELTPPKIDAAIQHFEQAAALATAAQEKERIAFGLGAALIHRGREQKSAGDVRRGLQELSAVPDSADRRLQVAQGHFALGLIDNDVNEFLAAGREYESIGSDSGAAFAASSYTHAARWQEARWNDVVRVLDPLLEPSHQATPDARLRWQETRGIALYRLGNLDRARRDLEPVAAAKYPGSNSERGFNAIIAASYVLERKWAESKPFSEAALATPFSASERDLEVVVLRNASVAYLLGTPTESAKAIAALDRLAELSPAWPDFPLWMADAYSRAGDQTRAATWYQKIADGGTAPARVHLTVGAKAFCSNQLDVAEASYRRALDANGDATEKTMAAIGIADVSYVRGRDVQPLQFNDDLAAADKQYDSVHAPDEKTRRHIAAMRGHIAYIRRDWDAALAYYGEADANDAAVQKFIHEATQAKAHGITKIDDVPPDERGPRC